VAGANQPLRSDLRTWYYVSHSDVWVYYTDGRAMGERTLRLGIEALREWTQFFEFKMSTPVRLHLYPDPKYFSDAVASNHRELGGRPYQPVDYYAQNVHGIFSPYNGPWPIEQVPIYYPGTYRGLNEQVRAAVLRAMLLNMFLSQDQRGTVYNRLNLFLPEWFLTGLSAYLGEGWSVRDESMMRSLTAARADQLIDDPTTTNPLARVVQKSFWHALEVEHGTRKIAELVYMMRLTRSVESGFRAVFGYTLESTTAKWRAFCTENYYSAEGQDVRAESNFIPLEKGQETTIAAAANPKLPVVAGITLSRFNRIRLVLYDRRKTSRTVIWGPTPPVLNPALATQQLGIGWSADGKTLAACLPKDKYTILYFYDLKAQQGSFVWLKGLADWVSHLEWSPDGKHLVLAANRFGQSDIFLFEIRNSRLTQLTRDAYDDLHPAWQPDGKAIFFQSNRDTALVAKDRKPGVGFVRNSYDIYRLNAPFERADTLRRITATPHIDETQPNVGPNGLQYLSDARGLNDLSRHLEGDAPPALMTQYRQGIAQWSRAGKRSLLGLYENGRPRYFLADTLDEGRSYALRRTPYAQRKVKQRAEADQAAVERRLRREERAREAARFDSTLRKLEQPADTLAADTANRRVRFYVFDEDEKPLNRPRRTPGAPRRQLAEVVRETTPELPPVDSIKALRAGPRTYSLNQQAYRTVAFFDPIFGLGMQNEVWAEDPFREYRLSGGFRLFNDLNSHDIWSRYQWLHGRTTYEVGFERQQRLFEVPDFYRFITFNPQLSMGLRIDPWSRVVADVDVLYFERRDINLIDRAIKNNSASTTSLLGGLSYIHDRTRERDHFPVAGWRLQLGGRSHYSITRRDQSFSEVHFDGRAYLPLPAEFNLAFRLSAGAYIGHDRPKYMPVSYTHLRAHET
jgi:Tol biopolymer transport system component